MTKEEKLIKIQSLKDKIIELKKQENQYNAMQMALKLVLNGTYGAFGNEFFVCSNKDIASAITGMGRNLIQYMDKCNQDYWYNKWHLDTLLHEHLGITNVKAIDWSWINTVTKDLINLEEYDKETLNKEYLGGIVNRKVPVSIYADTDSCINSTVIRTDFTNSTIEDFYNRNIINGSAGETLSGHESVLTKECVLNYNKEKGLYYAPVKRIIRHKVSKQKWKMTTESGKSVIVTSDHSLIIFRDGEQIMIKPQDVKKGDVVLSVKD